MPAGMPYFAWVDVGETTFLPEHLRWDEQVFSFNLSGDEGDPDALSIVVRRPRNISGSPVGLLGPGREIWCWFALDCGTSSMKFRGRVVGVPFKQKDNSSDLVTLVFVARPIDLVSQKLSLSESLKVLPYYDEVVIDPSRRNDPDVVLEGYTKVWHFDRETHVVSASDEITGEDGTVIFDGISDDGKVLEEGFSLDIDPSGPLTRVDMRAEYTWTQQAQGTVDLTQYLLSNWPHAVTGYITSYSMNSGSWVKNGTGIGDGWDVADAGNQLPPDYTVRTVSFDSTAITKDVDDFGPVTLTAKSAESQSVVDVPGGSIFYSEIPTQFSGTAAPDGSSASTSYSATAAVLPLNLIRPTLVAGYTANRQCTEVITFSLFADVQHVLTNPEDGEALRIDDVRSVNLSEAIGDGTDAYIPIGNAGRRSYIKTELGNQSLEHLIVLARAHLLQRSRVVEIAFAPKLSRMPEITLRKNVSLADPRIGQATGKIIGYSVSLDGNDGRVNCQVRIGCTIGKGGTVTAVEGTPTYCSADYVGSDYQQYTGQTVLIDTSVGYEPPTGEPNDDGLELLSTLTPGDVIEVGLVVENDAQTQFSYLASHVPHFASVLTPASLVSASAEEQQAQVQARSKAVSDALTSVPTKATFKLKSMSRQFSTDYEIQVTDLKIPTGYDLEVA